MAEAVVVQGALGAIVARNGATRLRERLTGAGSYQRRRAAYHANAEFLASMDLDPEQVLGSAPETDVTHRPELESACWPLGRTAAAPAGSGG